MKITDSEIIKTGEQELIDAITADLDWGAIEEIFLKEHNLGIEEDIEYKKGDIVAIDNQIAYKLEFIVKVSLSVLLNRNGEYLSVTINNQKENQKEDEDSEIHTEPSSTETDTGTHIEESVPADGNKKIINDEAENAGENISEEPDTPPFVDLTENNTDDMGQKVDNIVENIKKAG